MNQYSHELIHKESMEIHITCEHLSIFYFDGIHRLHCPIRSHIRMSTFSPLQFQNQWWAWLAWKIFRLGTAKWTQPFLDLLLLHLPPFQAYESYPFIIKFIYTVRVATRCNIYMVRIATKCKIYTVRIAKLQDLYGTHSKMQDLYGTHSKIQDLYGTHSKMQDPILSIYRKYVWSAT